MAELIYPAILEKGAKDTFGASFPDFPDCVVAGRSTEETVRRAHSALAHAVYLLVEHEKPLPVPTLFERVVVPDGCEFIALVAVSVDPPDPSERVNIYLPKSLIARADKRATDLGMSRSSFFGLAVSYALNDPRTHAMTRMHALASEEFTKPVSQMVPARTKGRKAKKAR